jgi:hypothetical protein
MALYNGWCFTELQNNFVLADGSTLTLDCESTLEILGWLKNNNLVQYHYLTDEGDLLDASAVENMATHFGVTHHRLCVSVGLMGKNPRKPRKPKPNIKKFWQCSNTWDYDTETEAEARITNALNKG